MTEEQEEEEEVDTIKADSETTKARVTTPTEDMEDVEHHHHTTRIVVTKAHVKVEEVITEDPTSKEVVKTSVIREEAVALQHISTEAQESLTRAFRLTLKTQSQKR